LIRNYALVTTAYWGFTLTDGALRMLVLLHFHTLGYTPFEIASLFLFYEFFGIVTNLVGGWIGARLGLRVTLLAGLALQVAALVMLAALDDGWGRAVSVAWVMAAQGLSGVAKDLTKMSSKSAVKALVPEDEQARLYKWVALLTGSKNALKGAGFFFGGLLLSLFGFTGSLLAMAAGLAVVLGLSALSLPGGIGRAPGKAKLTSILSKSPEINALSMARFFLFGSRDVWFVVALPVFLYDALGWSFTGVGGFLAAWVIGYGFVQSLAPSLKRRRDFVPDGRSAGLLAFVLSGVTVAIAVGLNQGFDPETVLIAGLASFGVIFAVNSAVHSYLIVAWSDPDRVAMDVGFYYMANAAGRLAGTVLSGAVYQTAGLEGCLWLSAGMVLAAALLSLRLPHPSGGADSGSQV